MTASIIFLQASGEVLISSFSPSIRTQASPFTKDHHEWFYFNTDFQNLSWYISFHDWPAQWWKKEYFI